MRGKENWIPPALVSPMPRQEKTIKGELSLVDFNSEHYYTLMFSVLKVIISDNSHIWQACVMLPNLHLVPRLRMIGTIPPLTLHAFIAWKGTNLTL